MIELRWKVEQWTEYRDGVGIVHTEESVLQYRDFEDMGGNMVKQTEWIDVPTEYVDE